MSDRSALLKSLGMETPASRPQPALVQPQADEDECMAFGYLRGIRDRSLHLQFRLKTGQCRSFPYGWLGPVHYDPSRGITLTFVGDISHKVTIEGRNLAAEVAESVDLLNRGILRHRVVWIREMEAGECRQLPEDVLTVERIRIEGGTGNEG
jgi:hypothetical protein